MALRWGILGTGAIAKRFAAGIRACANGELVAVGSREQATALAFTSEHGGTPYDSYQAVLDQPNVDAVYISLPHHLHAEWTIACARAGKHILCEKPFTLNALEAERALAVVRECDVFFLEAWMYRSHPQTLKVREMLQQGVIGEPLYVQAEFGYAASKDSSHFKCDARFGGGGLLDVGSYPVSFSRMVAGSEPIRCDYVCDHYRGYDGRGAGSLLFRNGLIASIGTGVHIGLGNTATIYGAAGKIHLPNPWFCSGPILLTLSGKSAEEVTFDTVPDLWGNQASIVERYLPQRESPTMPWSDTLGNMRALDAMRASAGLVFDSEARE